MRPKEEILKSFDDMGALGFKGFMLKNPDKANLLNPKLQLEALLDIRELLIELTKKIK